MKSATFPDKAPRMGRPPLNMKIVPVRLPPELVDRIDALAGTYGRAKVIRAVLEAGIEQLEREKKG